MKIDHHLVQAAQEGEPFARDSGPDKPAVSALPTPDHQPGLLQPVEQPGGIGYPGYEAVPNLVAAKAVRTGTSQNAERVVLRRRQAVWLKDVEHIVVEPGSRSRQTQHGLLFEAAEGLAALQLGLQVPRHDGD